MQRKQTYVHAAQYMTCDQSWTVKAGLISDRVSRVCNAVINEVMS